MTSGLRIITAILLLAIVHAPLHAQAAIGLVSSSASEVTRNRQQEIVYSPGYVLTQQNELLPNVSVVARSAQREFRTTSDANGEFRVSVPAGPLTVNFEGINLTPLELSFGPSDKIDNLRIRVTVVIAPIQASVVIKKKKKKIFITDTSLNPTIDRRNDAVYKNTLFERDDQLVQTLNAGINAGQHEGGGKSLEIRRFGYNLDHGGVNGGLKVLVDNVQQNLVTQGHGQGYLGQLKSLTPEVIDDVEILNGPFSAQYGDFSGLGVVQIRLKESLPDQLTFRFQAGNFNSRRAFLAYSPHLKKADSFIAYEGAYTDGPFISPGRYRRDNVTHDGTFISFGRYRRDKNGSYTHHFDEHQSIGFKLNFGRNNFFSSGQIPLDLVATGELDRFGFIDPFNGGRVRTGIVSAYYKKETASGGTLKVDGFVSRTLFDLFSNFTFFLNDPVFGDGIQQHDSRLQEGANLQYLRPHKLFGQPALFTAGANFHAAQINIGLFPAFSENPIDFNSIKLKASTTPRFFSQRPMPMSRIARDTFNRVSSCLMGAFTWRAVFATTISGSTFATGSTKHLLT